MCAYVSSGHNNSKIRKLKAKGKKFRCWGKGRREVGYSGGPKRKIIIIIITIIIIVTNITHETKSSIWQKSLHGREDWARLLHISYMNEMGPLDVLRFTTTEQTAGFF
ncbi:hypothetical protein K445DRAFT_291726 [Daldinia sp. EC12]|nr:hypothetical protein K445DRAFT_291726 [Daldinia sp. EC12]